MHVSSSKESTCAHFLLSCSREVEILPLQVWRVKVPALGKIACQKGGGVSGYVNKQIIHIENIFTQLEML